MTFRRLTKKEVQDIDKAFDTLSKYGLGFEYHPAQGTIEYLTIVTDLAIDANDILYVEENENAVVTTKAKTKKKK